MMTEMMQVMKNMSKADNGNEEVIDLSNAPKADGYSQSDKKRKPRRKRSKQVRTRDSSESESTSSSECESDATSDDSHTPSPEHLSRHGIMKEYQNYLALMAVSLGRCGLTTSMM